MSKPIATALMPVITFRRDTIIHKVLDISIVDNMPEVRVF